MGESHPSPATAPACQPLTEQPGKDLQPMGFQAFWARPPGKRVVTAATGCVLFAGCLSACAGSWQGEPPCFPPAYEVSPGVAGPGDPVTVRAADAGCNPRYGNNARIHITVTDAAGQNVLSTTSPMNDAGGFVFQFEVPPHAAPGVATVEAYPFGVDWCDDTGTNNRVPHAQGFSRTSCAAPAKPLTIAS